MKEKISSVYRWQQEGRRGLVWLLFVVLFCASIWWTTFLDWPAKFTLPCGILGFLVLLSSLGSIEHSLRLPSFITTQALITDHGDTIEDVMKNIRDEPVRYVATFSPEGEKVSEFTNLSPYKVNIDDIYIRLVTGLLDGATVIFNHPIINDDGYSRAFDESELELIVRGAVKTAIIVAPDMTYTIEIPDRLRRKHRWKVARRRYKIAAGDAAWFLVLGRTRKRLRSIKAIEWLAERMKWNFCYEDYQ